MRFGLMVLGSIFSTGLGWGVLVFSMPLMGFWLS